MSKWGRKRKKEPSGFDVVEPVLRALDDELRERMNDPVEGKKKTETLWPIHQINWQKSRYIYDLYYKYGRISKEVYEYCISQKLVDAPLIAKWKKPGYEKLCSTFVINKKNYPYGTVSRCRVPRTADSKDDFRDATTGCRGCASGPYSFQNIFGNKYGQRLAKLQILREKQQLNNPDPVWASQEIQTKYKIDQSDDEEEREQETQEENQNNNNNGDDDKADDAQSTGSSSSSSSSSKTGSDAGDSSSESEGEDEDDEEDGNKPSKSKRRKR